MYYDTEVFKAINGLANHSRIIDLVGIFLAHYLPYLLGVILLIFLFWPKNNSKNKIMVFIAIASAIISRFVVKTIILFFYNRPRPYITLPSAHKLISISASENLQSFPSGHAIFFFALSTVVYNFNKKLGIFFFICSILICIARVFVGVHWPSDILGGAVLGVMVGFIINWLYIKNQNFIDSFFR